MMSNVYGGNWSELSSFPRLPFLLQERQNPVTLLLIPPRFTKSDFLGRMNIRGKNQRAIAKVDGEQVSPECSQSYSANRHIVVAKCKARVEGE